MQQYDPTQTMEALKKLAPIVIATGAIVTSFFTLQSQISEIKLRNDLTDQQVFTVLLELKGDVKELKTGQELARRDREFIARENKPNGK